MQHFKKKIFDGFEIFELMANSGWHSRSDGISVLNLRYNTSYRVIYGKSTA